MNWVELLKFGVPGGFLASIIGWLASRRSRKAQSDLEEHNIYKEMYNDIKESIREQKAEYAKVHARLGQLERAVHRVHGCEHFHNCPVKHELLRAAKHNNRGKGDGRASDKRARAPNSDDRTAEQGGSDDDPDANE